MARHLLGLGCVVPSQVAIAKRSASKAGYEELGFKILYT